jgi:hypothetical protein
MSKPVCRQKRLPYCISQELSEAQVLTLIEVAVGGFQEAMQAIARHDAAAEVPF